MTDNETVGGRLIAPLVTIPPLLGVAESRLERQGRIGEYPVLRTGSTKFAIAVLLDGKKLAGCIAACPGGRWVERYLEENGDIVLSDTTVWESGTVEILWKNDTPKVLRDFFAPDPLNG
jgi:hypothetical protein